MHTIRTITGHTCIAVVQEDGPNGARRYTVRASWFGNDLVIHVEGITGQHNAQRLANRLVEVAGPNDLLALMGMPMESAVIRQQDADPVVTVTGADESRVHSSEGERVDITEQGRAALTNADQKDRHAAPTDASEGTTFCAALVALPPS